MKKAMFTLVAAAAIMLCGTNYVKALNEITIEPVTGITIDGDLSDWPEAIPWVTADSLKGTNTTNKMKFKMGYDDKFIYVGVNVEDSQMDTTQSPNAWEKDCIELFFVFNDTIADDKKVSYSNGQLGAWQLRKVWGRDMTDFPGKGFEAAEMDIPGGFAQEWKLPIDTLASTGHFTTKTKFRFEIQNGDNDGEGRNGQLFWNSAADDQWNTILHQGVVKFKWPLAVKQAIAKASSIRIKANSIEFAKTAKEVNVYSITGQLMLKARNVNAISTSALKSGVYFVVADGEKAKFVIK
ncbi:MAG TPA: sugar-binding protein [Bacteroidales bacterium]|nr:sugar-binding protein [Bacteroidales bacterium]HOK97756.1 sugar-binding protein [Bacteroidales bacterium]HPO64748.1 sugar-binding protein [Bacteroidales bacterium]